MAASTAAAARPRDEAYQAGSHAGATSGVERSLDERRRRYAKHATTAESLRAELDAAFGKRPLTAELKALRGG